MFIIATYAEINGTITVDGSAPAAISCSNYMAGSGSGGSILVAVDTLGYSTGTLRANGGVGGTNSYSSTYSGSGGSGGRIAVVGNAHSYASDGWGDWKLVTYAQGGSSGAWLPRACCVNGFSVCVCCRELAPMAAVTCCCALHARLACRPCCHCGRCPGHDLARCWHPQPRPGHVSACSGRLVLSLCLLALAAFSAPVAPQL